MVTVSPSSDGVTESTPAMASPFIEVISTECVSCGTESLAYIEGRGRLSTEDIDALRYRFEVIRAYAESFATEVVKLKAVLDRTLEQLERVTVSVNKSSLDGEASIASGVGSTLPEPVVTGQEDS